MHTITLTDEKVREKVESILKNSSSFDAHQDVLGSIFSETQTKLIEQMSALYGQLQVIDTLIVSKQITGKVSLSVDQVATLLSSVVMYSKMLNRLSKDITLLPCKYRRARLSSLQINLLHHTSYTATHRARNWNEAYNTIVEVCLLELNLSIF